MAKSDTVISAFSAEHMTKITGLTGRQLAYWERTGFFKPEYASAGDGKHAVRLYSFRDAVSLRTLNVLKTEHKISLQHLRSVAARLACYSDAPFAELKLRVANKEVHFDEPDTGRIRGVLSGQYVFLPIIDVMHDVERSVVSLRKRSTSQLGKTEQHRNVSHNARVFAGTRVPVRAIRGFLEDGFSIEQILNEYPLLTQADVESVAAEIQLAA